MLRNILASFVLILLAGCVALTSEIGNQEGVVYFLPKTLLDITVTRTTGADLSESFVVSVTAKSQADLDHRYVLKYNENSFYDDRFCIGRNSSGLLSVVQFAAEDKTQQIVFNISRFIAGSIGGPTTGTPTGAISDGQETTSILEMVIDPTQDRDVITFNNALQARFGKRVKLNLEPLRARISGSYSKIAKRGRCEREECDLPPVLFQCPPDEICYRTQINVPVELVDYDNRKPVAVARIDVVNPYDVGRVSIKRTFLVERVTKLWFDTTTGALTGVVMRKPSEAEGATMLPLNVVKAVLSTPSGLLAGAFADTQNKIQVAKDLGSIQGNLAAINTYFSLGPNGSASGASDSTKQALSAVCTGGLSNQFTTTP